MAEIPGMIRPSVHALPQIGDRMTFLYFEHCKLSRADSAITVTDEKGIIHVPAAAISVLSGAQCHSAPAAVSKPVALLCPWLLAAAAAAGSPAAAVLDCGSVLPFSPAAPMD